MVARLRMPRVKGRRRWAVLVALVVLVCAGGGVAWAATRGKSNPSATTTTTVTVSSSTVSQSVSSTGTIEPAQEADLSFAVSGTVTSVPVSVGQKVTKGQALAHIGTTDLKSAVTLAKANLTAAEDSLTSAESGSSSVQIASAKAQVAQAKSNLSAARTDLADGTLRSTITGTVASVGLGVGDSVGSSSGSGGSGSSGSSGSGGSGSGGNGSSSSSSSSDIVVISTTSWVVDASVGSSDLASIKKGLQAQITPTGATARVFGTVQSVGIVASSDSSSSSATFPVVIAVTGSPTGMYAGASANVTIIVKQVSGVLTVPTAALHSSGGKTYVEQIKSGKQVQTFVTVGTTYGPSTQITAGLASGAKVAVTTTTGTRGRTGTGTGTGRNGGGGFGGGNFPAGGFGGGGGNFGGGAGGPAGTRGGGNG
jgi:multidrug efflux pump subunit AcrA (membrane-fusion protein)